MPETIIDRFPVADWPVGPPHYHAGSPDACTACGAASDRAIP